MLLILALCAVAVESKKKGPIQMQCIRPIKAGFDRFGDMTYSSKKISLELAPFELPCRKCLPCRLNIAREKAIRCVHEAKMHPNNIFLTLTYNKENIGNGRLNYIDFQLFMMRLREKATRNITDKELREKFRISYMVTGEYGDETKRPHWHAIIFNYKPSDSKRKYTTERGEIVETSRELSELWGKGNIEFGNVTIESAGYVARYAAKKLIHGQDQEHDYHPIHKTSSKNAIGKTYLEKYYRDIFNHGYVTLPNGQKAGIPRYYTDWFKKNHFDEYMHFVSTVRPQTQELAQKIADDEYQYWLNACATQDTIPLSRKSVKHRVLQSKFNKLQERLKL